jgi:hypothetical protein
MDREHRPVSAERQIAALETLVEAALHTRGSGDEALAPGLKDVLDNLEPGDAALISELLMGMAFRVGNSISARYPFIEFAIHLGRAALDDPDERRDPTGFLRDRLPPWSVLEPAMRTIRRHAARRLARDPECDDTDLLRAYILGAAQFECLRYPDEEHGRLLAAGMLFAAAAQILTLRRIDLPE